MANNNDASTFTILYFANASTFAGCESEELAAPLPVTQLYATLEKKYPGIQSAVLSSSMVAVNTEYVDLTDETVVISAGDEVGIIPPVSSG
ncbi:Molybdopterin synthase sulfur carrier subunit [Ceratocystis lukuohia]|uniref:Molybdopterin synthase sulfur carrier subunit n=2 Tax=Ceratocystis TaxID=5157 RepID=A0A2C5XB12_9PEZI|nr:Molybdopterin synthase sulfur carrier subunit [Ceratocystis fimbriata CBS 114723]